MKEGVWLVVFVMFFMACGDNSEQPSLSVQDLVITEEDQNTQINLTLELSNTFSNDVSFELHTEFGTATAEDFVSIDTVLFLPAETRTLLLPITIIGDNNPEKDEIFYVMISDPFNATLKKDRAEITITNDDIQELVIPSTGYVSADSYPGKTLVWEDNFLGNSLDEDAWSYEIGNGCNVGLCGWGNNELQYYTEENTSVSDGYLIIEAKEESIFSNNYTSSRLITKGKRQFQKGRIDIRAAMPYGQGMWPALWLLGENIDEVSWPACGEIDIMEMVGGTGDDEVFGTIHWSDDNDQYAQFKGIRKLSSGRLYDEFHVYSIEWDDTAIRWFLDDSQYHVIDITPESLSEFHQEFFAIINLAVGGNLPGSPDDTTIFPQWLIVDYIKVFQ